MSARKAVALLAVLLFIVGGVLALIPVHINDHDPVGEINCGTALSAYPDAANDDLGAHAAGAFFTSYEQQCSRKLGTQRAISFPILGVAVLALGFLALTRRRSPVVPVDEQQYRQQQDQADR